MADRIRVGLVGANAQGQGWGPRAHIPALRTLPEYELAAVCTAHADTAAASQQAYGIPRAFHDYAALANDPEIDLVAVVVKVPDHHAIVTAALNAGKHVYCEWPLGANLAEAEAMAALARSKGVRTQVGLQGRGDPGFNYLRELVGSGYVGDVLAVTMTLFTGGVLDRPANRVWAQDRRRGSSQLTIASGHAIDGMCYALGEFAEVSAKVAAQVTQWRVVETGELVDTDSQDNVLVSGVLEGGALASVHVAAIPYNATGWRLEVYGHDGTIIASTNGMPQMTTFQILGSQGKAPLAELPVPDRFVHVPEETPHGPPHNIASLYVNLAQAIGNGGSADPDFDHAVYRHRMLDAVERASDEGRAIKLS